MTSYLMKRERNGLFKYACLSYIHNGDIKNKICSLKAHETGAYPSVSKENQTRLQPPPPDGMLVYHKINPQHIY